MKISRIVFAVVAAAGLAAAQNVITVSVETASTHSTSASKRQECSPRAFQQVSFGQILKSVVVTQYDTTARVRVPIVRPASIDSQFAGARVCETAGLSASLPKSHGRLKPASAGASTSNPVAPRRKGFVGQRGV
ncbi:MAG TPA: hypothetical protein VH640_05700 [Bryobacteraceae bacterium]|jgi:hypothetical protein